MAQIIPVYTDAFHQKGRLDIVHILFFFQTLKQTRLDTLVVVSKMDSAIPLLINFPNFTLLCFIVTGQPPCVTGVDIRMM